MNLRASAAWAKKLREFGDVFLAEIAAHVENSPRQIFADDSFAAPPGYATQDGLSYLPFGLPSIHKSETGKRCLSYFFSPGTGGGLVFSKFSAAELMQ